MTTIVHLESEFGDERHGCFSTRELAEQANAIIGGIGYISEETLDEMPDPIKQVASEPLTPLGRILVDASAAKMLDDVSQPVGYSQQGCCDGNGVHQ